MHLSDLAEDLIYFFNRYPNGEQINAFLCDKSGSTIWHSTFPRNHNSINHETHNTIDIKYFEKFSDDMEKKILSEKEGTKRVSNWSTGNQKQVVIHNFSFVNCIFSPFRSKSNKIVVHLQKIYKWRRLSDWYIICMVHVTQNLDSSYAADRFSSTGIRVNEPVILASAASMKNANDSVQDEVSTEFQDRLVFHRLDMSSTTKLNEQEPKLCQYFKHISISDTPTLYLSPKSFKSPFQHLRMMCEQKQSTSQQPNFEKCFHRIENIMAYIKDTTNLLTNPGLQPHVRNDVLILSHFIELLRVQHTYRSKIEKYVIRRYITSTNGIILMYPGFTMPNDFDPSRRIWYQKTMENSGKLTITAPYLDVGGSGFIITISHAVFENIPKSRITSSNHERLVAAIVSIDVTLGFLYQVLLQSSDHCRSDKNIKCFLIDDMGYLVVHASILEPKLQTYSNDLQFIINEHITHRESFVASDILLHKNLVEKKVCQNLLNRKVQRFYKFNMSMDGTLTNIVNGERTKYQIESVTNTNLFAVLLNYSTEIRSGTFCPCSTVDKVCFNCKRIEFMNCECPCECQIETLNTGSFVHEYMYGDLLEDEKNMLDKKINLFDSIEICARPIEEYVPDKKSSTEMADKLSGLSQCINFTCEIYVNQLDCLGILGCEWCQLDIDGETNLLSPFCTHASSCFAGILGSNTPYGDSDIGVDAIDSIIPSAFALYPLAFGGIIILFFIIGFGMYCYRHNLEPGKRKLQNNFNEICLVKCFFLQILGSEQLYVESIAVEHNFGLPLSRLDYDSITPHSDTADKTNNIGVTPTDISPYRIPGYFRRPNGESDHGYSTMTPHDDSEHACFTLIEPLINNKCSNQSISDAISLNADPLNSNSCSNSYNQNSNGKIDAFTNTPIKNYFENSSDNKTSAHHIQAPVTVHHPMEAIL